MYYGYVVNTSVGAGSPFLWTTKTLTNNNITYNASTGTFTINTPGWYEIEFNASLNSTGSVIPTLIKSGVASTYALAVTTNTAVTDNRSLSFHDIIQIVPSNTTDATLQVLNKGVACTVVASNFSIKRIG